MSLCLISYIQISHFYTSTKTFDFSTLYTLYTTILHILLLRYVERIGSALFLLQTWQSGYK